MAWGGGSGGGGGGGGGARPYAPLKGLLGTSGVIAPPLAPGLPPRVSTHAAVVLIVLGFFLGRFTSTPSAAAAAAAAAAAIAAPPPAAAALPLHTLPPAIRALRSADERHAALAAAVARREVDATALLPDLAPLGRAWLRESGLLALRPPLTPAASGSPDYFFMPFQILSWHPRIVVFPGFIDAPRRARVRELASARMEASSLAWRPTEKADPNQQTRTSKGAFLSRDDDPSGVIAQLEERIAAATLLPPSHGEAFNVLRYDEGGHYDSHMDTFDPREFGPQASQRVATMLLYLSDVDGGGETIWRREGARGDRGGPLADWGDCSEGAGGFRYAPRAGDAVLFFSLLPDGKIDPRALHGGCPVVGGRPKWVMTKWLRTAAINT
jgi:prolyl 4-hydroxylase